VAACAAPAAALMRSAVIVTLLTAVSATAALAQIYVVVDPDGTRRFTNEPVAGAEVFLETHFTRPPSNRNLVPFRREIDDAALRAGIDARLVEAVIAAESAFDPRAISKKGAQGLMQLMPDTADRFGVGNVWDPRENIEGGTAYLRWLIQEFDGQLPRVLAAYNAGEGAVTRHGGVPPYPETIEYIDRVLAYYRALGGDTTVATVVGS
jgi:soluble lytic murein transglycosylase-like protein